MTTEALFDLYFPDLFAKQQSQQLCYIYIGGRIGIPCSFTNYPSGYIKKVSMGSTCPMTCLA